MDTNVLDEASRAKLDDVVSKMTANNEPEQNIQAVVDDFKTKYGTLTKQTPAPQTGGFMSEVGQGLKKGFGSTIADLGSLGETALNAGADIFHVPKPAPMYNGDVGQQMHAENKPDTFGQKVGYYGEKALEFLTPVGGFKAATKAPAAVRATTDALEAVAPKLTSKGIKEAYEGGRATVSGVLKRVGIKPDASTVRAAKASEGIVRSGKTAAENSVSVNREIGREANNLRTALKSREIQPIVQPQELQGLYQKALQEISENPFVEESGARKAQQIFTKFQSYLPKDKAIEADDILTARQKLDSWIEIQKGSKVFDPSSEGPVSIALRAIRQGANDLLISKAQDVAVKDSFARQTALYDALEKIATKGPAEVGSTSVGRYLSRHPIQKGLVEGVAASLPLGVGAYLLGKSQ